MTPMSRMTGDTAPVAGASRYPTTPHSELRYDRREAMYYAFWAVRLYYCQIPCSELKYE